MSLYLQNDERMFFGRSSILRADADTDLRKYRPDYFPKKMIMSLTSRCNLRCTHCMRGHCADVAEDTMSREMIERVAEVFFPRVSSIQIGGIDLGEQMFSPHFGYFIDKVRKHDIALDMITNGTLINRTNAREIAASLARVLISAEGIGDNYRKIRGAKWESLRSRIELLLDARQAATGSRHLAVCLNVCTIKDFRDDYFSMVDYAAETGIDLIIMRNFIPNDNTERGRSFLYDERAHNDFYSSVKAHAASRGVLVAVPPPIPTGKKEKSMFRRKPCSLPFEVFGMQADGKVVTCCLGGAFDLGRLTPGCDGVMDLWLSENYNKIRMTVNTKNPPEPCRVCEAVCYNPLAYRPTPLYLGMKRLLVDYRVPGVGKMKKVAAQVRRVIKA